MEPFNSEADLWTQRFRNYYGRYLLDGHSMIRTQRTHCLHGLHKVVRLQLLNRQRKIDLVSVNAFHILRLDSTGQHVPGEFHTDRNESLSQFLTFLYSVHLTFKLLGITFSENVTPHKYFPDQCKECWRYAETCSMRSDSRKYVVKWYTSALGRISSGTEVSILSSSFGDNDVSQMSNDTLTLLVAYRLVLNLVYCRPVLATMTSAKYCQNVTQGNILSESTYKGHYGISFNSYLQ